MGRTKRQETSKLGIPSPIEENILFKKKKKKRATLLKIQITRAALRFDGDFNKDNEQFEPIDSFETLKPIIPKELMDYCKQFEK